MAAAEKSRIKLFFAIGIIGSFTKGTGSWSKPTTDG
jgi:hypothetical protein